MLSGVKGLRMGQVAGVSAWLEELGMTESI